MMAQSNQHSKYRMKVTAGGDYDPSTHQQVSVNGNTLRIDSDRATVDLAVRVQDYKGYPEGSPTTSDYFKDPLHLNDQYSLSFSITFKEDVNGNDLFFGNDFDRSLRDRLPPGFNAALRVVKWTVDPSIDGDAYADQPYLYSPALASWNQFRIGDKNNQQLTDDYVVREGADGDGEDTRSQLQIPDEADARRKHFQTEANRQGFTFEAERTYMADFGNQYISFSDMSIRLPGIHIPVVGMVDDEHNELRYVLKDPKTGRVYLVVSLTLVGNPSQEE